jgi:predicted  nucleic acid-binding Zn-ribbon protein
LAKSDTEDDIMGNNKLTHENKKKYEAMYEVETEMNDFIGNFESNREKVRDKMAQLQNSIVAT